MIGKNDSSLLAHLATPMPRPSSPRLKVPQVLPFALPTGLQVCVAMELSQLGGAQTTPPMQTINILTNSKPHPPLSLQLYNGHVGGRWEGFY